MSPSPGSAHPYKRDRELCNQPQTKPKLGSLIKGTLRQLNEEIATQMKQSTDNCSILIGPDLGPPFYYKLYCILLILTQYQIYHKAHHLFLLLKD